MKPLQRIRCQLFPIHYLYSHLDRFPQNLGTVSDEQGKRFHQDLKTMEERYQGRWDKHMMAGYCWSIKRECSETVHKRKSYKRKFMPEQTAIELCLLIVANVLSTNQFYVNCNHCLFGEVFQIVILNTIVLSCIFFFFYYPAILKSFVIYFITYFS